MKRMKVMIGKRRMTVLLTLTVLVLAAAAIIASSASFTAASANPGNVFTAGNLAISNSKTTGSPAVEHAVLAASGMRPGDVITGTVTISNIGSVPGQFYLTKSALTGSAALAAKLDLTIQEVDGSGTPVGLPLYNAKLNGTISNADLGIWSGTTGTAAQPPNGKAATHTYKFTVAWVNSSPGGDAGDTALMGTSCSYDFGWSAVASSTIN